jgi:enoyl-CoA hydratase/carnithine racemase
MATNAPLSVRVMKQMLDRLIPTYTPEDAAGFDARRIEISRSNDMREGLQAFFERRAPVFRGV